MIVLSIVVLLFGACYSMPMDNNTETIPGSAASVDNGTETSGRRVMTMDEIDTNITTTEAPPSTAAAPLVPDDDDPDCPGHRPKEGNPRKFQKYDRGVWVDQDCQLTLIWFQSRCWCDYNPDGGANPVSPGSQSPDNDDPDCPGHRAMEGNPRMFEKFHLGEWIGFDCPVNLIWFQSRCWCDWSPAGPGAVLGSPSIVKVLQGEDCSPLFNATFDDEMLVDHSGFGYGIGRVPWQAVTLEKSVPGANGGAARVKEGQVALWFTGGNDLGNKLQIKFRFKVMQPSGGANTQMVLLSNPQCTGGPKTVEITYRPSDQRYEVFFRDQQTRNTTGCNLNLPDAYAFHEVDFVFFNNELSLHVDGVECFTSTEFKTRMRHTACYIGLGGPNFDGYFDEAILRKGCRL